MSIRVNYEALVSDYWNNLTTVLRGFSVGPDLHFLDAWVPQDDDDARCILSVVEAAFDGGLESITVELGTHTMSRVSPDEVRISAGVYGVVEMERHDSNLDLRVTFSRGELNPARSPDASSAVRALRGTAGSARDVASKDLGLTETLPSGYAAALDDLVTALPHQGLPAAPAQQAGLELVSSADAGVKLAALVDPRDGRIAKIGFEGETSPEQCRLLELLCRFTEGRPIQDASDHAPIDLEYRLRRNHSGRPVPGIVMPENVSSAFKRPTRLIRGLMTEYRARTGYPQKQNFYDPPPSPHWRRLSEPERITRIQAAIDTHPSGSGVRVVRLEGFQRFVIESEHPPSRKACNLLDLERHVKANVESTLFLGLQPRVDQNKLRRLNEKRFGDHDREEC